MVLEKSQYTISFALESAIRRLDYVADCKTLTVFFFFIRIHGIFLHFCYCAQLPAECKCEGVWVKIWACLTAWLIGSCCQACRYAKRTMTGAAVVVVTICICDCDSKTAIFSVFFFFAFFSALTGSAKLSNSVGSDREVCKMKTVYVC